MNAFLYNLGPESLPVGTPDELCMSIMLALPAVCRRTLLPGTGSIRKFRHPARRTAAYRRFEIPKKSGGVRTIMAPTGDLKDILTTVNSLLSLYWEPKHSYVHGFTSGRSVVSGAEPHVGKNYVFNLDLKDFFPSITKQMVARGLERAGFDRRTARFLSEICTVPGDDGREILPQGAPTSPLLSNISCMMLDLRLAGLAAEFSLDYTRYADDMTFSAQYNAFGPRGDFRSLMETVIREEGFRINEKKTRLQKRGSRQEVTGLTVCRKVNVSRKWIKDLRAQIHRMETVGFTPAEYRSVCGKVGWIRQVRGAVPMYRKLRARLRALPLPA